MSDRCQMCGPDPQPCPVVLCAACAIVTTAADDRLASLDMMDQWSPKRLAWAFGCAAKDSDEERRLFRALKKKIRGLPA